MRISEDVFSAARALVRGACRTPTAYTASDVIAHDGPDRIVLYLHGTPVADARGAGRTVRICIPSAWDTPTTRRRVAAVLSVAGVDPVTVGPRGTVKNTRTGKVAYVPLDAWLSASDVLRSLA